MLLSRCFDGFSDLVMGVIVERTNCKWGKSRPWLLWMSIPFALSAVLLFTVPRTTGMLQFLYLFVTYNFCTTICYTAINLPYGSLSSMMIRESSERDKLSVLRMGLSPIGKIVAATCTLPLVKLLGNDQAAWIKVMSVWAVLALALLLLCFFKCEEKVQIEARKKDEKLPIPTMLKALFANQYFWAVMLLWTVQSVSFTITGTILPYYCKYIFNTFTRFRTKNPIRRGSKRRSAPPPASFGMPATEQTVASYVKQDGAIRRPARTLYSWRRGRRSFRRRCGEFRRRTT